MTNTQPPPKGADQIPAGEAGKANGTTMVTVGCKLPNGLVCELGSIGDDNHKVVRLNGSNSARVIGGYGLTQVSEEFWRTWVKKNARLEFVRKGYVFAHGDEASASDHATEFKALLTGLEPLDPMKPDARVKGLLGPDGKPLVEVDVNHFNQGRSDVAQFGRAVAR